MTGILLFVALAFFAFAQAASARNGAQSAADAAALAAAQEARDELLDDLGLTLGSEDENWLDWLTLDRLEGSGAQAAAEQLAAENDSAVTAFGPAEVNGFPGYDVEIETNYAVGDSIIPGTESMNAIARATAVVEPRCDFDADADPAEILQLDCDGELVEIDPEDFQRDDLPDASVLFSVHLAE